MASSDPAAVLRSLPAVGKLLAHPAIAPLRDRLEPDRVSDLVRAEVEAERARRLAGAPCLDMDALASAVLARATPLLVRHLRPVINATGVVINTNLGRAPLAGSVVEHLAAVATGYCNLEIDLPTGRRGSRHTHVEAPLCQLTGAESAVIVNNCAAAVMLLVDTFARGREVVVSRGQLIEIGGSFRLPEVLEAGGARLVEVGTTNRTYPSDFERAIGPDTGALLLSHTSNYRVVGFTAEVGRADLARLGREREIVTIEDLGSGLLEDLARLGLPGEPLVQDSLAAGIDLVAVSGDKLLGGPQCGVILGRKALVDRLKANPMMRALRPDKLALAALEATLALYLDPRGPRDVPVLAMLARPEAELAQDAARLASLLSAIPGLDVDLRPGTSAVGGGTLPGVELPTRLVAVRPTVSQLDDLAARLRTGEPSVVARIADGRLLLDPRTLLPGQAEQLADAMRRALP